MTLQQEAYSRIDQMSEDGVRALINILDNISIISIEKFREKESEGKIETEVIQQESQKKLDEAQGINLVFPSRPVVQLPDEDERVIRLRKEKKNRFMASAGQIDIDKDAILEFRERSIV